MAKALYPIFHSYLSFLIRTSARFAALFFRVAKIWKCEDDLQTLFFLFNCCCSRFLVQFLWNLDVDENSYRDFPSFTIWNTLMSCDPRISARMEQSYGAMGSKSIIKAYLKFYKSIILRTIARYNSKVEIACRLVDRLVQLQKFYF